MGTKKEETGKMSEKCEVVVGVEKIYFRGGEGDNHGMVLEQGLTWRSRTFSIW
jgi:hypothetical protein